MTIRIGDRVLVCGDREWKDADLIAERIASLPTGSVVIHGAAQGADTLAGRAAKKSGHKVLAFPADWGKFGKAAGPRRNSQMLTEGKPDYVLAFHDDIEHSKGTADMVKKAKAKDIPVTIYSHADPLGRSA